MNNSIVSVTSICLLLLQAHPN